MCSVLFIMFFLSHYIYFSLFFYLFFLSFFFLFFSSISFSQFNSMLCSRCLLFMFHYLSIKENEIKKKKKGKNECMKYLYDGLAIASCQSDNLRS
jgi:integral membrane sensor domain MASE1